MQRKMIVHVTLASFIVGLACLFAGCNGDSESKQYNPQKFIGFFNTDRYSEALKVAREDAKEFSNDHNAQYSLGNALCHTLKPVEAIEAFERAIEIEPKHAESHYLMAFCYLATEKETEAKAAFQKALECYAIRIEASPQNIGACLQSADCLFFMGKRADALEMCKKAIEQKNDPSAHEKKAYVLYHNEGLQLYPAFVQKMFDANDRAWREKKTAEAIALNKALKDKTTKPKEEQSNDSTKPDTGGDAEK